VPPVADRVLSSPGTVREKGEEAGQRSIALGVYAGF
jgi:hypothetical protein